MHVLVIARQEKKRKKQNSNETPKKTDFLSTEKSNMCEGLQTEFHFDEREKKDNCHISSIPLANVLS